MSHRTPGERPEKDARVLMRLVLLVIVTVLVGCQPPSLTTSAGPLTPLVVGTEQHVSLEWEPGSSDVPVVVRGYISNQSPYTYDSIRVLVDALGPAGEVLGQRLVWAPGVLAGGARLYFDAAMGPAHQYRARIFSWERRDRRSAGVTPSPRPASAPSRDSAGARRS